MVTGAKLTGLNAEGEVVTLFSMVLTEKELKALTDKKDTSWSVYMIREIKRLAENMTKKTQQLDAYGLEKAAADGMIYK